MHSIPAERSDGCVSAVLVDGDVLGIGGSRGQGRDVLRHENEPIFPRDLGKWVLPFPGRTAPPVAQLLRRLWGRAEMHEGCPWNCSQGFVFPRKRCSFSFSYLKQKQNLMTEGAWFLFSGNLLDFLISAECVSWAGICIGLCMLHSCLFCLSEEVALHAACCRCYPDPPLLLHALQPDPGCKSQVSVLTLSSLHPEACAFASGRAVLTILKNVS